MTRLILTVSELINAVNQTFADCFPSVWIKGEVSDFKAHSSGHFYFTLKDKNAQINAVMFRGLNRALKFRIENGQTLVVHGHLAIYPAQGRFQMVVNHAEPDGVGALTVAFEQLKLRLAKEGLFDLDRKKPIPFLPSRVGVITSTEGAAVRDIVSVIHRRFPGMPVVIFPVAVQGEGAAKKIAGAVDYFSKHKTADVLIVARGGGSLEDLMPFNEEVVARAISACTIPVVSGVGHETDVTICDFVADLRAATPSAAAELCVPIRSELVLTMGNLRERLVKVMKDRIKGGVREWHLLKRLIRSPKDLLDQKWNQLAHLEETLQDRLRNQIAQNQTLVETQKQRILLCGTTLIKTHQQNLERLMLKLNLLGPKNVLERGFLIGKNASGHVVTRKTQVNKGEIVTLVFYDGDRAAKIE